jgi:hypothetical protein
VEKKAFLGLRVPTSPPEGCAELPILPSKDALSELSKDSSVSKLLISYFLLLYPLLKNSS